MALRGTSWENSPVRATVGAPVLVAGGDHLAAKRRTALATAHKAAGYTQEQLAAVLHVERSTVIWQEA